MKKQRQINRQELERRKTALEYALRVATDMPVAARISVADQFYGFLTNIAPVHIGRPKKRGGTDIPSPLVNREESEPNASTDTPKKRRVVEDDKTGSDE